MEGILIIVIFAVVNIYSSWQKQKKNFEAEKRGRESSSDPLAPILLDPLQELLRKFDEAQKKYSQNSEDVPNEMEDFEEERFEDDFEGEVIKEEPEIKPVVSETPPQESPQKKFVLNETHSNPVPQNQPSFAPTSLNQSEPLNSQINSTPESKTILEKAAYFAITCNTISEDLLIEEFMIGNAKAASLIKQLEYLGICGKNMGELNRIVLVKNENDLINILKRASDLNLSQNPVSFEVRHKRKFVFSKEEAEKGVIWSKILDEPRFKKHWTPQSR